MKKILLASLIALCFVSCKKDDGDEGGSGNFLIGVSNSTPNSYQLQLLIDGENQGTFIVQASQQGNYSDRCGDLVHAATLDNVFIANYVASGDHTWQLKDASSGHIAASGDFTMRADGCISQQVNY